MKTTNREEGYDAHMECPRCRAEGLVTASGFVPHLLYFPALDPPFHCTGIHGGLSDDEMRSFGLDPAPPPNALPDHEPAYGSDPRRVERPEWDREEGWPRPIHLREEQ